jgi:hypothetical protein
MDADVIRDRLKHFLAKLMSGYEHTGALGERLRYQGAGSGELVLSSSANIPFLD